MKKYFVITLFMLTPLLSNSQLSKYYKSINYSIELFVKKEYVSCLDELMKIEPKDYFPDDRELFIKCIDSVEQSSELNIKTINKTLKRYKSFLYKIPFNQEVQTFMYTENNAIDFGHTSKELVIKSGDLGAKEAGYLMSIITVDRYLSFVRINGFNQEVIDSLYTLAGENILNIFKNVEFSTGHRDMFWNDNLMLAISHGLNSIDSISQYKLLESLKKQVYLGNIHAQQYAIWFDEIYSKRHNGYSYYGLAFNSELISVEPLKIIIKAKPIMDLCNINKRRNELMLGDLKNWYLYKKISYDFDLN